MSINPLIYGTRNVQIVLQTPAAVNQERLTFQTILEGSMRLSQVPEGIQHTTGSGGSRKILWSPLGFRTKLEISWDYSLPADGSMPGLTATSELWSGSVWNTATQIENAEAIRRLLNSAFLYPCIVYPHKDDTVNFFAAQPDLKSSLILGDHYGIAHGPMIVKLIAQSRGTLAGFI